MFFPWLISIPFFALVSAWNHFFCKQNRKSFRICHSLEWKQGHAGTAWGCVWRVLSGKTAWQVPCLLLPLHCRIKGRLVNSDCTAFEIKTSGYKIKISESRSLLGFPPATWEGEAGSPTLFFTSLSLLGFLLAEFVIVPFRDMCETPRPIASTWH